LGERLNGIQEVVGSIPIGSTKNIQQVRYLAVRESRAKSLFPANCPCFVRVRSLIRTSVTASLSFRLDSLGAIVIARSLLEDPAYRRSGNAGTDFL
jgi:hypothetical protein